MFPYTEKYTESESDIQNNNLFYKICQKCQNVFYLLENFGKLKCSKLSKLDLLFCIMYKFHNLKFVIVVSVVILS